MRTTLNLILFAILLSAALPSCVSSKKFNSLMEERDAIKKSLVECNDKVESLTNENEELTATKTTLEEANASLEGTVATLQEKVSTCDQRIDEAMKAAKAAEKSMKNMTSKIKAALAGYSSAGLEIENNGSRVVLSMPNKIMYNSGSVSINQAGRDVIKLIASKLNENSNLRLRVEGHTDKVPVTNSSRFLDNWELSQARANIVTRRLIMAGVSPTQLTSMGRADTIPAGDGSDNASNRRTEFVIIPNTDILMELVKE